VRGGWGQELLRSNRWLDRVRWRRHGTGQWINEGLYQYALIHRGLSRAIWGW
jgi:hypothetical protein